MAVLSTWQGMDMTRHGQWYVDVHGKWYVEVHGYVEAQLVRTWQARAKHMVRHGQWYVDVHGKWYVDVHGTWNMVRGT